MTIEEAKKILNRDDDSMRKGYFCINDFDAIEVLKSVEHCEDAVSRKAMLDYQQYLQGKMPNEENYKLWKFIKDLPSVTPTRKKGKWIKRENIHGLEQYYKCSNCGNHCLYEYVEIGFKNAKTNYCPNCGSEMESEE